MEEEVQFKEEEPEEVEKEVEEKPEVTPEERIVIRTYPKAAVMLYTLGILALIFGIIEIILPFTDVYRALGLVFVLAYFFLGLTMAFEFTEARFLLILALIAILVLLYVLLGYMGILPEGGGLQNVYQQLYLIIEPQAYLGIALASFFILFLIWLSARFNYWVIEPNQVLHKTGFFGKVERFSTRDMRFSIDIRDIFEYLFFFKSGTLILDFPTERKTFALALVPRIKEIEKKLRVILGYVEVE